LSNERNSNYLFTDYDKKTSCQTREIVIIYKLL